VDVPVELWLVNSEVDNILLVEVVDVDEGPDNLEGNGDDHEHAGNVELSSGGCSVSGEEHNEEGACDEEWNVNDDGNDWVVPGEVVIQDQEEVV